MMPIHKNISIDYQLFIYSIKKYLTKYLVAGSFTYKLD